MVVVFYVELNLAGGLLFARVAWAPISRVNADPAHAAKFVVNHEAKRIWHIRLVGNRAQAVPTRD